MATSLITPATGVWRLYLRERKREWPWMCVCVCGRNVHWQTKHPFSYDEVRLKVSPSFVLLAFWALRIGLQFNLMASRAWHSLFASPSVTILFDMFNVHWQCAYRYASTNVIGCRDGSMNVCVCVRTCFVCVLAHALLAWLASDNNVHSKIILLLFYWHDYWHSFSIFHCICIICCCFRSGR